MDFQGYLQNAGRLIRDKPLFAILGGFLSQLLIILSLGLMVGPLAGGYLLAVILFLQQDREPTFNDLFSGFTRVGRLFPYLVVVLLIIFGFMLFIVPGLVFATWWVYALPLMAHRDLSMGQAMRRSMDMVNERGFFMHLVFLLMITIIPAMVLNVIVHALPPLVVLKLLLPPLQAGCLAGLYLDFFEDVEPRSGRLRNAGTGGVDTSGAEEAEDGTEILSSTAGKAGPVDEKGPPDDDDFPRFTPGA